MNANWRGPHKPSDCALLVALPTSREEYDADLRDPRKDYARANQHKLLSFSDATARQALDRALFIPVQSALRDARLTGAEVVTPAGLADLGRALRAKPVVVLLAHWKWIPLEEDATVNVPRLLAAVERLLAAPGDNAAFAQQLSRELVADDWISDSTFFPALCRVVERGHASFQHRDFKVPPGNLRLTRVELEALFPDGIAPQPVIELGDGLQTAADIVAQFPKDWNGTFDMLSCHSGILAKSIRANISDGQIRPSTHEIEPKLQCLIFRGALSGMLGEETSYFDAAQRFLSR